MANISKTYAFKRQVQKSDRINSDLLAPTWIEEKNKIK